MQSVKYFFVIFLLHAAGKGINAQSTKAADNIPTQSSGGSCSYFPVVNGMKFTYQRKDKSGDYPVVESYSAVKEKTLKSGRVIKGYKINTTIARRNNSIIYYYCEEGSMKMYAEMIGFRTIIKEYEEDYSVLPSDYNKPVYKKTPIWETEKFGTGKYLGFTELKAGRLGTEWVDRQEINNQLVTISGKIIETGITVTVRGKTYSPVIHVQRRVAIGDDGDITELNTQDIYYAKGIGKVKVVEKGEDPIVGKFTTTQELVSYNLPGYVAPADDKSNGKTPDAATNARSKFLKGKLDEALVGNWKFFRIGRAAAGNVGATTLVYSFNADGSFAYYMGPMASQNLSATGVWKRNMDSVELLDDKNKPEQSYKISIKKWNNVYTGKPSILISWRGLQVREFETMDNKNPWPGLPAYGDKMVAEVKAVETLEGEIDQEMVGVWKNQFTNSYTTRYSIFKFNADGTGELTEGSTKGQSPIVKFEWRIKDNIFWKSVNCDDGKCIEHYQTVEKVKGAGNKRAFKLGPYNSLYQYMGSN